MNKKNGNINILKVFSSFLTLKCAFGNATRYTRGRVCISAFGSNSSNIGVVISLVDSLYTHNIAAAGALSQPVGHIFSP